MGGFVMRDPPSWDYGATSACCWVLDAGFVVRDTRFVIHRVGQFVHNGLAVRPAAWTHGRPYGESITERRPLIRGEVSNSAQGGRSKSLRYSGLTEFDSVKKVSILGDAVAAKLNRLRKGASPRQEVEIRGASVERAEWCPPPLKLWKTGGRNLPPLRFRLRSRLLQSSVALPRSAKTPVACHSRCGQLGALATSKSEDTRPNG